VQGVRRERERGAVVSTKPAPTLDEYLDLILAAAEIHGEEADPEHEVGDLQEVIYEMWSVLTDDQKAVVVASTAELVDTWGPK
jgi:hypothetical protein